MKIAIKRKGHMKKYLCTFVCQCPYECPYEAPKRHSRIQIKSNSNKIEIQNSTQLGRL